MFLKIIQIRTNYTRSQSFAPPRESVAAAISSLTAAFGGDRQVSDFFMTGLWGAYLWNISRSVRAWGVSLLLLSFDNAFVKR